MEPGRAGRRAGARAPALAVGAVLCLAAVALSSCGGSGSGAPPGPSLHVDIQPGARPGQLPVAPGSRGESLGPIGHDPSQSGGVQLDVLGGLQDDTPIYNGDFADPFALRTADEVYLYASNTTTTGDAPGAHVPVIGLTRDSGFEGEYLGDALPELPRWTVSGYQWAPSVWSRPDGTYVMYYSTPATIPLGCLGDRPAAGCVRSTNGPTSAMCISRATGTHPAGPFVDRSSSAFICPVGKGGAIDPSVFVAADGTPWLLWKSDGDCCNRPTTIYSQQLSPDGLSVVGSAHPLVGATQAWEGGLVEGPSMIQVGSDYWLFYSANLWGTDDYGIGLARCASVTGPCTKPLDHAWLSSSSGSGAQSDPGPGGEEFFQVGGVVWMVHHGLAPGQSGNDAQRRLYVDLLAFPPGQLPRIAPRAPSAALAGAILYYGDPHLPTQPLDAYLTMVHLLDGAPPGTSDASLVADGGAVCRALGRGENASMVSGALASRDLGAYPTYVIAVEATLNACPGYGLQGLKDIQQALSSGS